MQHVVPLLLTWALLCVAPGSAPNQPANPIKRHPHHPRAIKIGGVKGDNEEHLTIYAINRGWTTTRMGRTDSRGKAGVRASLLASFGDLHYKFDLEEVIEGVQEPADEQSGPRRRRR